MVHFMVYCLTQNEISVRSVGQDITSNFKVFKYKISAGVRQTDGHNIFVSEGSETDMCQTYMYS